MAVYEIIECEMCGVEIEKRGPRVRCAKCSNIKHNKYVRDSNREANKDKIHRKFIKHRRG